jgi:hypothetical protein
MFDRRVAEAVANAVRAAAPHEVAANQGDAPR